MAKKKVVQEEIVLDKVEEVVVTDPLVEETVTQDEQIVQEETLPLEEQEVVPSDDVTRLKLVLLDSLQTPQYGVVEQVKLMVTGGASKQEILDELVGFQTISQEAFEKFISLL